MPDNMLAAISFILITTFTPGPNNISSASMGVLYGYRRTMSYLAGITLGVFLLMMACGWISASLLSLFPVIETPLRYLGAVYILWLAFKTVRASYAFKPGDQPALGFANGVFLQLVNVKAIVYGLTLFSAFLTPIASHPLWLILTAVALAGVTWVAVSAWALAGTGIKTYLQQSHVRLAVNVGLALLLVYTALKIADLV